MMHLFCALLLFCPGCNACLNWDAYGSNSCSYYRDLGQFHMLWQWLLKKLSGNTLAMLKVFVLCDVGSSSCSAISLVDAKPNSPHTLC